eukprot:TRINITY_DN9578_c0_g1_i1.p1 TRINITY_DN9578_c0_g1~~TRINITY_DN9578_c0_g1_i1.p1  ORF type:complete len:218 (+),score=44.60 TRINITY_DN9578_c0_g1_i1:24-677(+)
MSSITISTSDISTYISNNDVSIGNFLYKGKESTGSGCRQLLFGGEPLSIIVSGTVYKMKYKSKEKLAMKISTDIHEDLKHLTDIIYNTLGREQDDNTLSYKWKEDYWTRGRISGTEESIFTKIYKKNDTDDFEEIPINDCPNSFKGYVCINLVGVYFTSPKPRKGKVYLIKDIEEIVVERKVEETGGSKILSILEKTKTVDSIVFETETITDEEDLW